jgi:hypothetical protein
MLRWYPPCKAHRKLGMARLLKCMHTRPQGDSIWQYTQDSVLNPASVSLLFVVILPTEHSARTQVATALQCLAQILFRAAAAPATVLGCQQAASTWKFCCRASGALLCNVPEILCQSRSNEDLGKLAQDAGSAVQEAAVRRQGQGTGITF